MRHERGKTPVKWERTLSDLTHITRVIAILVRFWIDLHR